VSSKSDRTALLKTVYALTDKAVPMRFDCGKLCSALCCRENITGSENAGGMSLLPGEDVLLSDCSDFEIKNTPDGNILICKGTCNRKHRPFMCRIFPYYAHISQDENGKEHISLLPDPRALRLCPLVSGKKGKRRTTVYFRRNMIKAVRMLLSDDKIHSELLKTSSFCDSLYSLYNKML